MIGAVLAGGRGSRMGGPKAFLEVEGLAMIERVLASLAAAADDLVVVAAPGEGELFVRVAASFRARIVVDEYPGSGPLAGIHAALRAAGGENCLVAACDQPFLSPELLRRLASAAAGDAGASIAPRVGGRIQPFPAVYAARALPVIEERLSSGKLRLRDLLEALKPSLLEEVECEELDPGLASFVNLNTREELEAAREGAPTRYRSAPGPGP
jgi:molybdenum cofactor guanylyltransferase